MPSDETVRARALPGPADESLRLLPWLWEEAKFHLLPWGAAFRSQKGMLKAVGIGLAVAVTVAWILSGVGRIGPVLITAWWIGWSVYEVVCRRIYLPWIKEGQWWKRDFRPASLPDTIAYVATKNLLIGVVLFAVLRAASALHDAGELSFLRWLHWPP